MARGGGRERPKVYRGVESVNALRKCRFLFSTRLKRCGPSPRCSSPWPPRQSCWCPRRPWQAARSTTTTTTTTTRSTRDSNTSSPGNGKGGIRQEVIFPLYLFFWQEPILFLHCLRRIKQKRRKLLELYRQRRNLLTPHFCPPSFLFFSE